MSTLREELKEHQDAAGADDAQMLEILCDYIEELQLTVDFLHGPKLDVFEFVNERLDGINAEGMLMRPEDFNDTAERHG